jgi:DHA1 family tetracycline resistance protein-like MFS transporter
VNGAPPPAPAARGGHLGAIFLTVFMDLLGFGLVMPLLPRYAETLHASPLQIGLLGASYSGMQFIFVPVWGRLSDRIGRRPVLLGSILATSASMLMLGFAGSLVWLYVARLFGGMATANIATAQAYIADTTTRETRARGMGLIGMAFGLGFILGPFFGGILSSVDLGLPAKVAAGLAMLNFVWALRALPESLSREMREKNRDHREKPRIGLDFALLRRTWAVPGLAIIIVLFFVVVASFSNLEQTFALYTHDEFGLDSKHTGYILGVVGLVSAIVQGVLIGPLNRRFGEIRLIRVGTILQSVGMGLFVLAAGHHPSVLYGCSVVLSFGNGLTNPSLPSLASKRAPPEMQGGSLGVLQSMGALARVFGPTWGGFVYGLGHRLPYITGAAGLLLAWMLALSLRRREDEPALGTEPAHGE